MLSCPLVILPLVILPPLSEFESSDAPLGSTQAVSQGGTPLPAGGVWLRVWTVEAEKIARFVPSSR